MRFQIKEKIIYSESDLLHFGEKQIFGDIVNSYFPDYTGISLGSIIYQSANKDEIESLKNHLEIRRIKSLNEQIIAFFDDDKLAAEFYASDNFLNLQALYLNEFNLTLIRRFQMEVLNNSFYIPPNANDQQVLNIQKLLNLYFYYIEEDYEDALLNDQSIDWKNRLAILYQKDAQLNDSPNKPKNNDLKTDSLDTPKEFEVLSKESKIKTQRIKNNQKPWWKFW